MDIRNCFRLMKEWFFLFCVAVVLLCVWTQVSCAVTVQPRIEWTGQVGTSSAEQSSDVVADNLGGAYVVGYTSGDLSGVNEGFDDAFIGKFDPWGNPVWTRQFGTDARERAAAVSVDGFNNIYVAGYTSGDLGGLNQGVSDAFLRKYDSDGNVLWTRQFGGQFPDIARGVSADAEGNVYVTGEMYSGSRAITADAVLWKYDAGGNLQWTRTMASSAWDVGFAVSTDTFGNVYVSGCTAGNLGGTNYGMNDAFVSKFDSTGNLHWIRQLGTTANDGSQGISTDSLGNVYISGGTSACLGDSHAGDTDAFVSKYDATGDLLWTRQLGTNKFDSSFAVSTDVLGNVYISGETQGILVPGSPGGNDAFASKYDTEGNLLWTGQWGTTLSDQSRGISVDNLGNIFISGYTSGCLGDSHAGGFDAFVAKINEIPEPSSLILLSTGSIGLFFCIRRRKLQAIISKTREM